MMMSAPPAHMFEQQQQAVESTAFIDSQAAAPAKVRDDFAYAETGARKVPKGVTEAANRGGFVQSNPPADGAEATAFLQSPGALPADGSEATAFLQSPAPQAPARPAPRTAAPARPSPGVIDSAAGEATAFLDGGGGLHSADERGLHDQATQMVQAVDEAQIEAWLAQQRSKQHQQQQFADQQKEINPDAGGGQTAVWSGVDEGVTGGYRDPVGQPSAPAPQHQGNAPVDWGPVPGTAHPGAAAPPPKKQVPQAAKKKGGALKWIILIMIVFGGLATGAYFVFFR